MDASVFRRNAASFNNGIKKYVELYKCNDFETIFNELKKGEITCETVATDSMLDATPIKVFMKDLHHGDYKTLHFEALSNGQFTVEIYDVLMYPEGLSCTDDPVYEKRFNDYVTANNHLKELSNDYYEVEQYESFGPAGIVNDVLGKEAEEEAKDYLEGCKPTYVTVEVITKTVINLDSMGLLGQSDITMIRKNAGSKHFGFVSIDGAISFDITIGELTEEQYYNFLKPKRNIILADLDGLTLDLEHSTLEREIPPLYSLEGH